MKIIRRMNRWIKWIIKSSKLYKNKELVDKVLASDKDVEQIVDEYFSKDENEEIDELEKRKEELKKEIEELTPQDQELKEHYNNKYPKKDVVYRGRSLPFSEEVIRVPVNVLITPNDHQIIEDLKDWGLYDSDEDFETLIPKIYNKIRNEYYDYEHDGEVWGYREVWEFPFEMREAGIKEGYDCDSWSIFQASYYLAAGLPPWRVRCVAGNTRNGGGHLTVHIYSKESGDWHHQNSTYGNPSWKNISKYPKHDDSSDKIGIERIWFSFNNVYSFSDIGNEYTGSRNTNKLKNIDIREKNE